VCVCVCVCIPTCFLHTTKSVIKVRIVVFQYDSLAVILQCNIVIVLNFQCQPTSAVYRWTERSWQLTDYDVSVLSFLVLFCFIRWQNSETDTALCRVAFKVIVRDWWLCWVCCPSRSLVAHNKAFIAWSTCHACLTACAQTEMPVACRILMNACPFFPWPKL